MKIQILRVIGRRAHDPVVVAVVDSYVVKWNPRNDWTCTCDEATYPECPHIPAVENLLDPRVTGETQ